MFSSCKNVWKDENNSDICHLCWQPFCAYGINFDPNAFDANHANTLWGKNRLFESYIGRCILVSIFIHYKYLKISIFKLIYNKHK